MVQGWERLGCSPATAGNLVAIELGLGTSISGWTAREISNLLFLAELRRTGRLPS